MEQFEWIGAEETRIKRTFLKEAYLAFLSLLDFDKNWGQVLSYNGFQCMQDERNSLKVKWQHNKCTTSIKKQKPHDVV